MPGFSVLFMIIWLVALAGFRSRSPRLTGTGIEEYRRVLTASFWTFGAIAIVALLLKLDIARGYLAVALPSGALGLVLTRAMWRGYLARKRAKGGYQTAVLAIGELDAVETLANELVRNPMDGYHVVGVGVPGYGPPRGEHVMVNGREIPLSVGRPRDWRRFAPAVPTRSPLPERNTSAFRESEGLCGTSSRWALTSWCRRG